MKGVNKLLTEIAATFIGCFACVFFLPIKVVFAIFLSSVLTKVILYLLFKPSNH